MRALALVVLVACSSSEFETAPANVNGAWVGTATNASSSCPGDFRVGETSAVNANVTSDGKAVSIKVEGSVGFWVNLLVGADTFTGTIEGSAINATLLGSKDLKDGLCTYRITATMNATTDGKKMNGTVTYKPNVVSGDCAAWKDCSRTQSFVMNK
jgi:hypothetical protein